MTNSQIATLRNINERPGRTIHTVGQDYAAALEAAGYITIRGGKCYPTEAAAAFPGRSRAQISRDAVEAYGTLARR